MRTDILDLYHFYEESLGLCARDFIRNHIGSLWGEAENQTIVGFGYSTPYLCEFPKARRIIAMAPDAQGIIHWPREHTDIKIPETNPGQTKNTAQPNNKACLIHEAFWPLPDRSVDKIILVHGLEEAREPKKLLREVWRVLADDGRLIIVAAQRRGFWAAFDVSPFAAGRPWLRAQLARLLERSLFIPLTWHRALHFPPVRRPLLLRWTSTIEKIGRRLWPGFCGVLIVEAGKDLLHPAKGKPQRVLNVIRPKFSDGLLPVGKPATLKEQDWEAQG